MTNHSVPPQRSEVATGDTWDLTKIFKTDDGFNSLFSKVEKEYQGIAKFRTSLKTSAKDLAACIEFEESIEMMLEKLGSYAFLKLSQDLTDNSSQEMVARYQNLATRVQESASYIIPEIISIPETRMKAFLKSRRLAPYKKMLGRLRRTKPHVLSKKEERLLAMQSESSGSAGTIFRQLSDADFKFGTITDNKKKVEVTNGNWGLLLENPDRKVRRAAFNKLFGKFNEFDNTLAATYNAQVQEDIYKARVRKHKSARAASLFQDNVPESVYDNLIKAVRDNIHLNHRYLRLHKKVHKIRNQQFYDTYLPLVKSVKWNMSYQDAVEVIIDSLSPLGKSYCNALKTGLTKARWVDKYENTGKRSGAFSAGGYKVLPYILMNYKENSIQGVYTLAHEGGHSMHTKLSAATQPFCDYDYSIFVAEVASTFNEQLLTSHFLKTAKDPLMRAYILDREINQVRATMIRQTMFAEFEKISHKIVEDREALTLERLKEEYGKLIRFYFGDEFIIDEKLTLEWARIPHFYSAFYVYKYATGLAAAVTLARGVEKNPAKNTKPYLSFLKAGASEYPLDILKSAGADLSTPDPVNTVMARMNELLDELEQLV